MAGEDKAIEIVLDKIWELKKVGVQIMILGHTKMRGKTDVVTGEEYETLTANLTNRYFNAIKTKLHVLGVASIDRSIEKHRVKQKVGADKVVGKVTEESRVITFRDNNFNIDSKSRFEEITPQIELDPGQFIEALEDAIQKAYDKQEGKKGNIEDAKKEQAKEKEERVSKIVEKENGIKQATEEELQQQLKELNANLNDSQKKVFVSRLKKEVGASKPSELDTKEKLFDAVELLKSIQ